MNEEFIVKTADFEVSQIDFLVRMLIAMGIGLVIGLERAFSSPNKEADFAGLRTLSIVSLMGFICVLLNFLINPYIFLAGFFGVLLMVLVYYWNRAQIGEFGSTTEFTAIFTYLLGGLTFMGNVELSLALMVVLVVLLSLKEEFQQFLGQINQVEISAFVRFVVMALLILPFLPNEYFGPFDVINPSQIGWIIVLTSGIGFIGYILMKFLGANNGVLFTGLVGGLISSTAVTWTFSKKSKINPKLSTKYAIAIFAAATILVIRVVVWLIIFNKQMLSGLILPLVIIFLAGFAVTFYFYRKKGDNNEDEKSMDLGEPLNIKDAVVFGIIYTGVLLLVSYANDQYGSSGIYVSSIISGLTDLDAIAISVAKLGGDTLNILSAQNAILFATLSNTLVKIGIALYAGSPALKKNVLIGYGLIFVAAFVGFLIINV